MKCFPVRRVVMTALVALGVARSTHAKPPSKDPAPEPAATVAEPATARALRLEDQGNRAMLEMRYVDALGLYEQARELDTADVGIDYSIARAHQLLGEFPEALAALERFDARASVEDKTSVGRLKDLFTDLRSRVSTLHLRCNQPGARVLVRDKVYGVTPLPNSTRLGAGAATIQLELDGFFPASQNVVLPAGGVLDLQLDLHARSLSSLLLLRTKPEGATVLIDEHYVGTSSPRAEIVLGAGTHRITATREGYDTARLPVILKAGSTREVTVSLERSTPVTGRWWFWTGAVALIAGGSLLTAALLTERSPGHGSLQPSQVRAPLQLGF